MELSDETKQTVQIAMLSHVNCVHGEPRLCSTLICDEVGLREDRVLDMPEMEAVCYYIADVILEGLILKGLIEPVGIEEDGGFLIGLTEEGKQVVKDLNLGEGLHDTDD